MNAQRILTFTAILCDGFVKVLQLFVLFPVAHLVDFFTKFLTAPWFFQWLNNLSMICFLQCEVEKGRRRGALGGGGAIVFLFIWCAIDNEWIAFLIILEDWEHNCFCIHTVCYRSIYPVDRLSNYPSGLDSNPKRLDM